MKKQTVRKQCAKCPWKKGVDPNDIPGGYCSTKHKNLRDTIATPGLLQLGFGPIRVMACHEAPVGRELACVGWLANQLGPGNNISLRMMARDGRFGRFETVGEQHERFEDTLPTSRKKERNRKR